MRKYFFSVQVIEEGAIHIADLEKALKFMKATKEENVILRQVDTHKPLHIEAGGNKLQLPSTNDIESAIKAVVIRSLLKKCQEGGWAKFGKSNLSTHSSLMTKDLISFANMRGILAKDTDFKLRIHCGEEEVGIVAGKAASGRLFTTLLYGTLMALLLPLTRCSPMPYLPASTISMMVRLVCTWVEER